jgi:hypothetical protein
LENTALSLKIAAVSQYRRRCLHCRPSAAASAAAALRKAERIVDKYGSISTSGFYGSIEIDEKDFSIP